MIFSSNNSDDELPKVCLSPGSPPGTSTHTGIVYLEEIMIFVLKSSSFGGF